MNIMELLQRPIMGMPLWLWAGVVGGGGIVLAIYLKRRGGSSSSGVLGQNTQPLPDTSQIDPYTGVPYSIESQINPATGLPAYYGGPGVNNNNGNINPPPPPPGPVPSGWTNGQPTGAFVTDSSGNVSGAKWFAYTGVQAHQPGAMALGRAEGPYQATPWWPRMTDLDALAHGKGA